jgi:hypothetical protein
MSAGITNVEEVLIQNATPDVLKLKVNTETPNLFLYNQLPDKSKKKATGFGRYTSNIY